MTEPDYLRLTRAGYDATAVEYTDWVRDELDAKPLDRAMLGAFAESVTGPVADIGCGSGRVTAHLNSLGVEAFGIDLSPRMIAVAHREFPDLRFAVGNMAALDLHDGELAGIVAWYSIIHVPDDVLPTVFAEFHRALAAGGQLLLAFQVGDEPRRLTDAHGKQVDLEFRRRQPADVIALLADAGFTTRAQLVREKEESDSTAQAFLLAVKV